MGHHGFDFSTPAPAMRLLDDVRIGAFGVAAAQSRPLPLALVQRRAVTRRCQLAPNPPRPASEFARECLDTHVPTVHAEIARSYLAESCQPRSEHKLVLTVEWEYPTCWMFGWNTADYVTTGEPRYALAGKGRSS
jgi:hypothetical protein